MPSHTLIRHGRALSASAYDEAPTIEDLETNRPLKTMRLENDADLTEIAPRLNRVDSILIDFPAFTDGRGFSLARLLRKRYNFEGLLIADGQLIPDQYAFAIQCGFDAIRIDEERAKRQQPADWLQGLADFGLTYQRGYAVKAGPATSVFDARKTAIDARRNEDPYFGLSAQAALRKAVSEYDGRIAMVSSLGVDSAVLLHMAAQIDKNLPIIFLDTLKHFRETLAYRDQLIDQLGLTNFQSVLPDPDALKAEDPDGTLNDTTPDACCNLRKVRPLNGVIEGYAARITGRKRYQTADRANMPILELVGRQAKVNPLAYWTAKDVTAYLQQYDLPPHPMLALGYLSVGCQPCTTRVAPGEDPRAGRWRDHDKTECGIHYIDGKWVPMPAKKTFEVF